MANSHLRVLFISHTYIVGVNQGKLNAIAKTGKVEVGLLTPSNWKALEWNRLFAVETPYPTIKVYTAPVLFTGRGGAYIYAPWKIWQVVNDFKPDLVQVEEEAFSLCALELAVWSRLTGKPLVVFGWENMNRTLPMPRRWVRQFVLNTAQLMLPGNQDGADLLQRWGYTGLMEVMPQMGVDTHLFSPRLTQERKNEEFRIGFLGRLVPEKSIDTILTAAHLLRERGLNFQVILCGSGSHEEALRQEAHQQQIADLVIWRGSVRHNQAPEEISNFDVLVLPSRTTDTWKEQFGHVLIEAMAMGVPVVGSNSGEIPNVIGRADLVFPEGDAPALAAILERMITEPSWRQELGCYCMTRVAQNYTHERIAERLIKLWNIVLNQKTQEYALSADR
ncbi:MAG: glycosyl transferase group 1 [Mastigocladus sp. ERB_26_2]